MDWLLEEVIVTAQKREERLIDVPISIAALSGETIKDAGIQNINELSYAVPNLSAPKLKRMFSFFYKFVLLHLSLLDRSLAHRALLIAHCSSLSRSHTPTRQVVRKTVLLV